MIDAHVHLAAPAGNKDSLLGEITGSFGRLIEPDGSVYQYLPPYVKDSSFEADTLIAVMDYYGVDKAVVLAHIGSGVNEIGLLAQRSYPDRLLAACAVNPNDTDAADQIRFWAEAGIRAAKFEMRSLNEFFGETLLGSEQMTRAAAAAADAGMTITIDPGPCTFPFYRPDDFYRLAERFDAAHFVLCHMGCPCYGIENDPDAYVRWKHMLSALKLPNVWTDTSAIADLFVEEEYPYSSALRLVHYLTEEYGENKLIWGSDIPGTFRNATYAQMRRCFEDDGMLSDEGKERLFSRNAEDAYRF